MTPRLRIDLALPEPAWRQIVNGLRRLLVAGELASGDRLPPVRQLALDLGVHHNTVAEAYRQLAAEGWIDLAPGRGAVVIERAEPRLGAEGRRRWLRRLRELVAEAQAEGWRRRDLAAALAELAQALEDKES